MKKVIFGIAAICLVVSALVLYTAHVLANDKPRPNHNFYNFNIGRDYNPDNQLSKSACGKNLKNPVINVVQKVQEDADSGVAGDYWAFDYYTRHIQVWEVTPASSESAAMYCATVVYDGNAYAIPGQVGPGNTPTGALINTSSDQPVRADMSGGYRATFNGILSNSPAWSTHGSVGTTNYQCDINANCPGRVDWVGQYFPAYTNFDQPWWGWRYNAGSHGTWINAIGGNTGNIL